MTALASKAQLRASLLRWSLFTIPLVLLLGFLSGRVAGSGPGNPWFDALVKPGIYPPPELFGIVWTILYIMMGLSLAFICSAWGARGRGIAIGAFVVQLLMNLAWSPLFFSMHRISGAFYLIVALAVAIVVTIVLAWKVRPAAGALLIPYLAWVCFAAVLNYQFLQANPDLDGQDIYQVEQRFEI
ncbi:MAG: tryptophan-rich sensory protein [Sphingomonadaceae bacterium]|nr:tryptophan-rich sensory protein [Sphingomonadaceae bacterium]